ncbi:MAG: glycosyltransferase [Leptospiraceae bacterium]|nr:glycosyltransferase [Leptospiraceae bacterium]
MSVENIRVMHINTARSWRGGERQVFQLAEELAGRGITQLVAGKRNSELGKRCQAAGIPFAGFGMHGEWDLLSARRMLQTARRWNINILHAHTARAHSLALYVAARRPEARLLVSRRVDFPARPNWLSRRKYMSPLVTRYIAISENVRRILIADGISESKIDIAYSGIDLAPFERFPVNSQQDDVARALRKQYGLESEVLIGGNVAALVPHKDQHTLLRALGHLRNDMSGRVCILILGEGRLRAELLELARSLDLLDSRMVIFAGFHANIYDYYRLFDFFIMSSKEEGLGTSVLDAMAAGLPVVATAGGGIPEMIDTEKGGLLVPVGDDYALGTAIRRIATDSRFRKSAAEYNRKRVRDFSKAATAEATLRIYNEVLPD